MLMTGSGFGLRNLLYAGGNRALIARAALARIPRPVSFSERQGDRYPLYDANGKIIGWVRNPTNKQNPGRNGETVYLRKD